MRSWRPILLADGDGDLDVHLGVLNQAPDQVYLNAGDGTLVETFSSIFTQPGDSTWAMVYADAGESCACLLQVACSHPRFMHSLCGA